MNRNLFFYDMTYFVLCKSVHSQNDRRTCFKNLHTAYEAPLPGLQVTAWYATISSPQILWRISLYQGSLELY